MIFKIDINAIIYPLQYTNTVIPKHLYTLKYIGDLFREETKKNDYQFNLNIYSRTKFNF